MPELTTFPGSRREWINRMGIHSANGPVDGTNDQKLVFAVLEAIDFDCFNRGDAPETPNEQDAKNWLVANRDIVRAMPIEPPSYSGVFSGVFAFLAE